MTRNLHSFTLTPSASFYVQRIKKGRKSGKVSEAIDWYFSSQLYGKERDDDYQFTGKLVPSSHGMPVPAELFDRIEELEAELSVALASQGGVKHHLAGLLRCLNPFRPQTPGEQPEQ